MTRLMIKNEDGLAKAINFLSNINLKKPWSFELKPYVKNRSVEQNSLLWKWNTIMAGEIGLTKNQAHEYIMRELMAPRIFTHEGKKCEVYSTRYMTTKEMSEYMNMYHTWAGADMGINLPLPEDQFYR